MSETRPSLILVRPDVSNQPRTRRLDRVLILLDPILEPVLGPLADAMLNDYPPHESNVVSFVSPNTGEAPKIANDLKSWKAIFRETLEDRVVESIYWTSQKLEKFQKNRRKRRLKVIS